MKVLFDVSTLGTAFARPTRGRTGVYRATEKIFRALARLPDMTLALCAQARTPDAVAWAQSDPTAKHMEFDASTLQRSAARWPNLRIVAAFERAVRPGRPPIGHDALVVPHFHHLPIRRVDPGVARVLILHDVLPITNPSWFEGAETELLLRAAGIVARDGWTVVFDTQNSLEEASKVMSLPRSFVVPLGVDHSLFRLPQDSPARDRFLRNAGLDGRRWFCTLGTLEPRKNLATAIRAFREFKQSTGDQRTSLVLAGTRGWGTDAIDKALEEVGEYRDSIILPGFISDEELPYLYNGSMAFLFPSLAEGFGLPPLEAMASGTPVIASNASCMPEILGDAAMWVDPLDVRGWAEAMRQCADSQELRSDLVGRGIRNAAKYTWESTGRGLANVLETVRPKTRTPD